MTSTAVNLRSSGPGGFSPFFSCGMRLLCSQEFICEIEFTQFISDLQRWEAAMRES
jgi:hypothetical protein